MSDYFCLLITVLYGDELLKCALKLKISEVSDECRAYPMEPESRLKLHSLLPQHVQTMGPLVDVQEIFEIEITPDARR